MKVGFHHHLSTPNDRKSAYTLGAQSLMVKYQENSLQTNIKPLILISDEVFDFFRLSGRRVWGKATRER